MPPDSPVAHRVYDALRQAILAGELEPGLALAAPPLAELMGTSVSPVRDAMLRLAGAGLLALQDGGGFMVPKLTPTALRDLHIWHGQLVRLALKSLARPISIDAAALFAGLEPEDGQRIADVTAELFLTIARHSKNGEHATAVERAGERLHVSRLREDKLSGRIEELRQVATLANAGRDSALREAVWAYHRRRLRRLPTGQ